MTSDCETEISLNCADYFLSFVNIKKYVIAFSTQTLKKDKTFMCLIICFWNIHTFFT